MFWCQEYKEIIFKNIREIELFRGIGRSKIKNNKKVMQLRIINRWIVFPKFKIFHVFESQDHLEDILVTAQLFYSTNQLIMVWRHQIVWIILWLIIKVNSKHQNRWRTNIVFYIWTFLATLKIGNYAKVDVGT